MITQNSQKRLDHLSFKGNLKNTRYGWLRLTPAHSVNLISEILETHIQDDMVVLDPFCGTGTTALVCAEQGIACDTTDINPFLLWLGQTKIYAYSREDVNAFQALSVIVAHTIQAPNNLQLWIPPLHQIEKWWDEGVLQALARAIQCISELSATTSANVTSLLKIAFCRTMIELAHVSFGHQSMSFKQTISPPTLFADMPEDITAEKWRQLVMQIAQTATSPIVSTPQFLLGDARYLDTILEHNRYSCVITSPPYPNRISYIRELRPYMYWLGYLTTGREAGELDWQAIGGTWGCATINLNKWEPLENTVIPFINFDTILHNIASHSPILARYVQKYFHDMVLHCNSLFKVMRAGGTLSYIIGNAKFYDVLLPAETIFASMFETAGFYDINIQTIRKRSSKKELLEFIVSAKKPIA